MSYYEQEALWNKPLSVQERERLELVKAILPDDVHTVLDVGCGCGAISNYLPEHLEITGLDFSAQALKYFKHKKILGNASCLPFEDDSFDLVICSDVLEHLKCSEFESAIQEIQRVAKNYILVISPNEEQLEHYQAMCSNCRTIFHVNWHIRSLTVGCVEKLFQNSFVIDFYTYFGGWWKQHPPMIAWANHFERYFHHWPQAVCPLCQAPQDSPPARTARPILSQYLQQKLDLRSRVVPTEMLVLFKGCRQATLRDTPQLQRFKVPGTLVLHTQLSKPYPFIALQARTPCTIYPASNLNIREGIWGYPQRGYIIVNNLTSWGDTAQRDGRPVRYYHNRADQQAPFLMPYEAFYKEMVVEYVDSTSEQILLQIYDTEHGFISMGKLSNQGSGDWRSDRFAIPAEIRIPDSGMLFRFVPTSMNAQGTLGIWRIYMQGDSSLQESFAPIEASEIIPLPSGETLVVYEGTPSWNLTGGTELIAMLPEAVQGAYWVDEQKRWVWLGYSKELVIPALTEYSRSSSWEDSEKLQQIIKELIQQ